MQAIALHWTRFPLSGSINTQYYWERISLRSRNAFIASISFSLSVERKYICVRVCPGNDGKVDDIYLPGEISDDEAKEIVDKLLIESGVKLLKESHGLFR